MVKNCQNILKNVALFRHTGGILLNKFSVDTFILL